MKEDKEEFYSKVAIEDLILVCLYFLEQDKARSDFEGILIKCFEHFSGKLSFSRKKLWPDSRKIDRPLRSLKAKKLVAEDKGVFSLTRSGKKKALGIANLFRQRKLKI